MNPINPSSRPLFPPDAYRAWLRSFAAHLEVDGWELDASGSYNHRQRYKSPTTGNDGYTVTLHRFVDAETAHTVEDLPAWSQLERGGGFALAPYAVHEAILNGTPFRWLMAVLNDADSTYFVYPVQGTRADLVAAARAVKLPLRPDWFCDMAKAPDCRDWHPLNPFLVGERYEVSL